MMPSQRPHNLAARCEFFKQVPLFADLTPTQCQQLAADFRERTYRKGAIIFHQEDESQSLFVVHSGLVRIFHPSYRGGSDTTVNLLASGGVIGEFSLVDTYPRSATAEAKRPTTLLEIHRDLLLGHVRQNPDLALALCKQVVKKARWTTLYAETIVQLDVRGRLLSLLLHFNEEYGRELEPGRCYELDLGMNQSDLASLVGANRGWVNGILGRWREQQLLDFDRGRITILDLPRVEAALAAAMEG